MQEGVPLYLYVQFSVVLSLYLHVIIIFLVIGTLKV